MAQGERSIEECKASARRGAAAVQEWSTTDGLTDAAAMVAIVDLATFLTARTTGVRAATDVEGVRDALDALLAAFQLGRNAPYSSTSSAFERFLARQRAQTSHGRPG